MANGVMQATIVTATTKKPNQELVQLALFGSDGTALVVGKKMPVQAASTAADLAALIVDFNALLTKLKNAGLMATS
jgi:head fiber protein